MSDKTPPQTSFQEFGLIKPVLKALDDVGYETPTPIQSQIIPLVLMGRDVLGQAQTGTGRPLHLRCRCCRELILKGLSRKCLCWPPRASWPYRWRKLFNAMPCT